MARGRHERPVATVDLVVLALVSGALNVGVLRRDDRREPAYGLLALPGGFVRVGEDDDLDAVARRVLRQKAAVAAPHLEQVGTRGDAGRDPRGWSLSVCYAALLPESTAPSLAFHPVGALPALAFDHGAIAAAAVERVRSKASYSALPLFLLDPPFTIAEAHAVFELVLGERIDAANFRRKILAQGVLSETGRRQEVGRPTRTYRISPDATITFRRPIVI